MSEPIITATCSGSQTLLIGFDSGEVVLPGLFTTAPTYPDFVGCGTPGAWAQLFGPYCAEPNSWDLIYRPPLLVKPGIWNIHVTATKNTLGALGPDETTIYNGYIFVNPAYCNPDPSFYCLDAGEAATLAEESVTRDGTDAVDFTPIDIEIGLGPLGLCACAPKLINVWAGPLNNDHAFYQLWSWNIRLVGTWLCDFP